MTNASFFIKEYLSKEICSAAKREKNSGPPDGVCPDGFAPMEGSVAIPRGGIKLPPDPKVLELDCFKDYSPGRGVEGK